LVLRRDGRREEREQFHGGQCGRSQSLPRPRSLGDKNIYWDYGTYTVNNGRVYTSYAAYLDKWTHIALVSAGTGGTYQAIYLDGVEKVMSTTSTGPVAALSGLQIGAWTGVNCYVKGGMDDFRIYNRVLSPTRSPPWPRETAGRRLPCSPASTARRPRC
jgi:hypothetical protein